MNMHAPKPPLSIASINTKKTNKKKSVEQRFIWDDTVSSNVPEYRIYNDHYA